MATAAQLRANRRNAQSSTGPRTDQGKATSSQNSLKFGIYSDQTVLAGEDKKEFERFRTGIYQRLQPADELERLYVDRFILAAWKVRRINAAERHDYEYRRKERQCSYDHTMLDSFYTTLFGVHERMQRAVCSLERSMDKARAELARLQKQRREQEENCENEANSDASADVDMQLAAERTEDVESMEKETESVSAVSSLISASSEVNSAPQTG